MGENKSNNALLVGYAHRKFSNNKESLDGCDWVFEIAGKTNGAAVRFPLFCRESDLEFFRKHSDG